MCTLWNKIREAGKFILFVLIMIPVGAATLLCAAAARGAGMLMMRKNREAA